MLNALERMRDRNHVEVTRLNNALRTFEQASK